MVEFASMQASTCLLASRLQMFSLTHLKTNIKAHQTAATTGRGKHTFEYNTPKSETSEFSGFIRVVQIPQHIVGNIRHQQDSCQKSSGGIGGTVLAIEVTAGELQPAGPERPKLRAADLKTEQGIGFLNSEEHSMRERIGNREKVSNLASRAALLAVAAELRKTDRELAKIHTRLRELQDYRAALYRQQQYLIGNGPNPSNF